MSRRLKKKIRELCHLDSLSKEDRLLRAQEILVNNQTKQKLCNLVQGLTFKDIDRAMQDIIRERTPTPKEQEELELREMAPEKFEAPIPALLRPHHMQSKRKIEYTTYTPEYTQWLIEQSNAPYEQPPASEQLKDYPTYSLEDVQALMNGTYSPEKTRKR